MHALAAALGEIGPTLRRGACVASGRLGVGPRANALGRALAAAPASLEMLAFVTGRGRLFGGIGGGVAQQGPQGHLNRRRDTLAFLGDGNALRGQVLPEFQQVIELLRHPFKMSATLGLVP